VGSTVTLYLPAIYTPMKGLRRAPQSEPTPRQNGVLTMIPEVTLVADELNDDRTTLEINDTVLLIVDNDLAFANFLMELAHRWGFKALVTSRGGAGIALTRQFHPSAMLLDIRLNDIEGWRVLQSIKNDQATRHLPIVILSNDDDDRRARCLGAFGMLTKPVSNQQLERLYGDLKEFTGRTLRRLLVIEDDELQSRQIVELVGANGIETVTIDNGAKALDLLGQEHFDCIVLDLGLPDMGGLTLFEQMQNRDTYRFIPIIVYTGRDLTPQEDVQVRRLSKAVIVKDARAMERLLDEIMLCLHQPQIRMTAHQQQLIDHLHQPEVVLKGRKVLVVDDDIRNIFAMASLLERYGMLVSAAEDGKDAILALERDPSIEVVLMDIMMPEMDGYDTMRAIRKNPLFTAMPIIALTAKAMKGDREKCLEAGASDYVAKPVDTDHLLSLLCVWLYRTNPSVEG